MLHEAALRTPPPDISFASVSGGRVGGSSLFNKDLCVPSCKPIGGSSEDGAVVLFVLYSLRVLVFHCSRGEITV